jgi:hypothetical protein
MYAKAGNGIPTKEMAFVLRRYSINLLRRWHVSQEDDMSAKEMACLLRRCHFC